MSSTKNGETVSYVTQAQEQFPQFGSLLVSIQQSHLGLNNVEYGHNAV